MITFTWKKHGFEISAAKDLVCIYGCKFQTILLIVLKSILDMPKHIRKPLSKIHRNITRTFFYIYL